MRRQLLPYEQMSYVYVPSHVHHTNLLFLVNNPIESVSGRCDMNRNIETIFSLQSNARYIRKLNGFDNKHFLIHRTRCHLVIQFSVANGSKQITQVCRAIFESFVQLRSITKNVYKFKRVR
jgi:hypothetical protein